ncbi:hypothetical protein BpHYR1_021479, partial [Brachionus plicatilis]
QRQKELQLFEQNDPVRIEMNRLRSDAKMKNNYSFLDFGFELKRTSDLTIMFQNIQSFNSNKENVKYDFGYEQADVIFLSECHNRKNFRQNEAKLLFDNYHLMDNDKFIQELIAFLNSNLHSTDSLVILGDFNIDFNRENNFKYLDTLRVNLNMTPVFSKCLTFKDLSQLDWCLTSKSNTFGQFKSQPYSTWFSDHQAIFTEITL